MMSLRIAGYLAVVTIAATCTAAADTHEPTTPPRPGGCISANSGDYAGCNEVNNGGHHHRYLPRVSYSPERCIVVNLGDYTSCNVGNSGRGDLPYR